MGRSAAATRRTLLDRGADHPYAAFLRKGRILGEVGYTRAYGQGWSVLAGRGRPALYRLRRIIPPFKIGAGHCFSDAEGVQAQHAFQEVASASP